LAGLSGAMAMALAAYGAHFGFYFLIKLWKRVGICFGIICIDRPGSGH